MCALKTQALVLLGLFALGSAGEVSPVEKVITLLKELKGEVEDEGKAEAKTYDTFACFCKDETAAKSEAITKGQDSIEEFSAAMGANTEDAASKGVEIQELEKKLGEVTKHIDELQKMREAEKTTYEATAADLGKGVSALEGAISEAKAGQASFLSIKASVQQSLDIADTLEMSPEHRRAFTSFLQETDGEKPDGGADYENHGAALIEMFESLDKEFIAKKAAVDQEEAAAKKDFNALLKAKTEEKKVTEDDITTAKEAKDEFEKKVAEATNSLIGAEATLKDDQTYLKDLTGQCELKAREWDQQSQMRNDEVTALSKALEIIEAKVSANAAATRFTQESTAPVVSEKPESVDDFLKREKAVDFSFLQLSSPRSKISLLSKKVVSEVQQPTRQQRALATLAQESSKLKSAALMDLLLRSQADPFAKVKDLIQQLIEKLVTEAAEDSTQKGWCDTEMGKAKNSQSSQMGVIIETNAELSGLEATKDSLTAEIADLTASIKELNDALTKTTTDRTEEKAENMDTLDKAKEGLAATKDAYDVLATFYKNAAKAKVSLLQLKASSSQPNKGNQAKGGGILAMLEVIISDFENTIKVTMKSEKEASAEFTKFERSSKASIASKETSKTNAEFSLKDTDMKIVEGMDTLTKTQGMLDDTLKTLEELNPKCVDTGMSAEEVASKRKAEIEALKKALCQLDPEGVEEDC